MEAQRITRWQSSRKPSIAKYINAPHGHSAKFCTLIFNLLLFQMATPPDILFTIHGMTCHSCVQTITDALEKLPGVAAVAVDLDTGQARLTVQIGTDIRPVQDLAASTVEDLGYEIVPEDNNVTFLGSLTISGMTCGHCTQTVHSALVKLPGAIPDSIHVSLDQGTASLLFSQTTMNADQLAQVIEDLGYDVEAVRFRRTDDISSDEQDDQISTMTLAIGGMTCSHCTRSVTHALQNVPGVVAESVQVDLGKRSATFSYHGDIDTDHIAETIEDLGYNVVGRPRIGKTAFVPATEEQNPEGLRKVVMRVLGMTCHSCVAAVTNAIESMPNVQRGSVRVDLETEMAMFICKDPNIAELTRIVDERGYDLENIQIIHNLIQPAPIEAKRARSITQDSIVSLGAISVETPVIAVPKKVTMQVSGMTCAR